MSEVKKISWVDVVKNAKPSADIGVVLSNGELAGLHSATQT